MLYLVFLHNHYCLPYFLKSKYHISKPVLAIKQFSINHLLLTPWKRRKERKLMKCLTLSLPDQICLSPYCRPCNSYNVSSENLVLGQLIMFKFLFFHHLSGWYCIGMERRNSVLVTHRSLRLNSWKFLSYWLVVI